MCSGSMDRMLGLTVFLCVLNGLLAQIVVQTPCPAVRLQPYFDIYRYAGRWYELARYPVVLEANQTCVSTDYTPGRLNAPIAVTNRGYNDVTKNYVNFTGDALQKPNAPGQLGVRFALDQPRQAYNVLATDYYNYALVFYCSQSQVGNSTSSTRSLWIMTRTPYGTSPRIIERLLLMAQSYGIDTRYLSKTQQFGCPRLAR